jgi:predicted RNA-binding protein (virulence factor B family)
MTPVPAPVTEGQRIPVGEASSAEDIKRVFFGLSKSDFKRALGALYRVSEGVCQ